TIRACSCPCAEQNTAHALPKVANRMIEQRKGGSHGISCLVVCPKVVIRDVFVGIPKGNTHGLLPMYGAEHGQARHTKLLDKVRRRKRRNSWNLMSLDKTLVERNPVATQT